MGSWFDSLLFFLVLLNPFILSVYMRELIIHMDFRSFSWNLIRAGLISLAAFWLFAYAGDRIFEDVLQLRFSSFLIFGGVTFLIIGIRLILGIGPPVNVTPRNGEDISASIAMPLIIGPGTISASVLTGTALPPVSAGLVIAAAMLVGIAGIIGFKKLHDFVRTRNERLLRQYMEVAGRITALFTGTFAIEMILNGIHGWMQSIGPGA